MAKPVIKESYTFDEISNIADIVDLMDPNIDYLPTVRDLKAHNVEKNLTNEDMTAFLLWLQNSLTDSEEDREINRYISKIINKKIV